MLTSLQVVFTRYIVSAFLLAMLVSELISWGIYMGWIHYRNVLQHDPSPFMHHSFYSIFLAVTIFVLATQLFQAKTILYKVLIALFMLSAVVNLFLNGGRLGQLAFFIALFIYIGLRYRVTFKSIGLSVVLVAGVFILAYQISPVFKKRINLSIKSLQNINEGNYNSSWGVRIAIINVTISLVEEAPIIGRGIGNTKVEFLKVAKKFPQPGFFPQLSHLHNGYMQTLVEVGIVGLLLFFSFLYVLLRLEIQKEQYILMVTIIVIYLVGFVGEPLFFSRKSYLLFNLYIAIYSYLALKEKKFSD